MENLKGRSVQINSGAMYPERLGEVVEDRGEQVVVYFPPISSDDQSELRYIAKFRLLVSEYAFCDIPACPGIYLIAKPIVEECA
ncbi:hypothetical protein YFHUAIHA_CDS0163 [Phage C48C1]|nr:hypothetical protein YFHUAIHA_CDS0163 [Phage C48C1]